MSSVYTVKNLLTVSRNATRWSALLRNLRKFKVAFSKLVRVLKEPLNIKIFINSLYIFLHFETAFKTCVAFLANHRAVTLVVSWCQDTRTSPVCLVCLFDLVLDASKQVLPKLVFWLPYSYLFWIFVIGLLNTT